MLMCTDTFIGSDMVCVCVCVCVYTLNLIIAFEGRNPPYHISSSLLTLPPLGLTKLLRLA